MQRGAYRMCVFGEMQMKMFKKFFGAAAIAAAVATAGVAPANAALKIELSTNGGGFVTVAQEVLGNTAAASVDMSFGGVGAGWLVLTLQGQDYFPGGYLMDSGINGSVQPNSTVQGFSVKFTQTNINLGGSAVFAGLFSNTNVLTPDTGVSRSLFLNNVLIASSTEGLADVAFQSLPQVLAGPFTLVEQIDISNARGSSFSIDDNVHVPEPGTIALMIAAMLSMLGFAAWRRRSAH
jgi:hypothetical protein